MRLNVRRDEAGVESHWFREVNWVRRRPKCEEMALSEFFILCGCSRDLEVVDKNSKLDGAEVIEERGLK
jgi:hypothetical protein